MNLQLTTLTADKFQDYLTFVAKIYPQRSRVPQRFAAQVLQNPFLEDPNRPEILLALDDHKIIGHFGLNPYPFHWQKKQHIGHSGFDFYVLESYRQHGVGKMLAAAAVAQLPYFGIGATPVAERIYTRLGATTIGRMYRYLWLRGPLQTLYLAGHSLLKAHWPRKPQRVGNFDLPPQVQTAGTTFELQFQPSGHEDYPWDSETITFSRSARFLDWRYFQHPRHYRFYARQGSGPTHFFVLRPCPWRGLSLLCMVDYRVPQQTAGDFQSMLLAARELTRQGRFDGLVVYSSLRTIDEHLQALNFRKIGQPTIVVFKGDIPLDTARIEQRQFVLATLADCDQDFVVHD
jgi:GNAT superfamily N-acetyltransferase